MITITLSKVGTKHYAHIQEFNMTVVGDTPEEAQKRAVLAALPKLALQHPDITKLAEKYINKKT